MALRILIVEDEPVIAMHLEMIVIDAGHEVVGIAGTMDRALRLAVANRPLDLAIMDIDLMTKPDGVEAARQLRERHDVRSLFVSAHLTAENMARAAEARPVGFIAKPFIDEQIVAVIEPYAGDREQPTKAGFAEAEKARAAGRDVGAQPLGHAGQCPWPQDGRRDLRRAWLLGFAEARVMAKG